MPALPGMHLCKKHQGNHSHYAEENCLICKMAFIITELLDREGAEGFGEIRKDAEAALRESQRTP